MSLQCLSASTQVLYAASYPIGAAPWTVTFWYKPRTVATFQTVISFCTTAADTGWLIGTSSVASTTVGIWGWTGAAETGNASVGTAWAAGGWSFFICRSISAASRRVTVIKNTGVISQGNSTTNVTLAAGAAVIGGYRSGGSFTDNANGQLAELAIYNGDIWQPGGALTDDDFVRRLSLYGPFHSPFLMNMLVEYRSFRSVDLGESPAAANIDPVEVYKKDGWNYTWTQSGSPTVAEHPPLMTPYRKFVQPAPRTLII